MSKLSHVQQALEANSGITIVGRQERNLLEEGYQSGFGHTVDFYIAPTKGVYTAKKLQKIMLALVPGLAPTCKDDFREDVWEMEFGVLYFDEGIGSRTNHQEVVLTDADLLPSDGFVNGRRSVSKTETVWRRVWVRLYPNTEIAISALQNNRSRYHISKKKLAEFTPLWDKLTAAF